MNRWNRAASGGHGLSPPNQGTETRVLGARPLAIRWALVGAMTCGSIGAIVGLIVGLVVHPPTAPFALLEIGVPATFVGGVVGLGSGAVASAVKHVVGHQRSH